MLRLTSETPVETLWDPLLPARVQQLPDEPAVVDELLADDRLLEPFRARWAELHPDQDLGCGRPTLPRDTYLRFMVIKHRYRWGYETLMREVSDSLHRRRFCLLPLVAEVPDESTVRKLTRRLGPDLVTLARKGARGLIPPAKLRAGSTPENPLLPETVTELQALKIKLRKAACDAGFVADDTQAELAKVGAEVWITGTPHPASHRTQRRLARYRVGSEGRVAHVKREFGVGRSRLQAGAGPSPTQRRRS